VPEGIEIEIYRRAAAAVIGRRVRGVEATPGYLRHGVTAQQLDAAIADRIVVAARRIGKLLLLDLGSQAGRPDTTLGLRFGMTGRLLVDGSGPIDELLYSTTAPDPRYQRFTLTFDDGELAIVDPRRLGSIELAPDETALGPDASTVSADELATALAGGRGPLKARLLDQARIAGIGNLIVDETLWRCSLAPRRPAGELDEPEVAALATAIRDTMADLLDRGGSHTGDLQEHRSPGALCPRDGEPLRRDTIGGRTTYWCPSHQT